MSQLRLEWASKAHGAGCLLMGYRDVLGSKRILTILTANKSKLYKVQRKVLHRGTRVSLMSPSAGSNLYIGLSIR